MKITRDILHAYQLQLCYFAIRWPWYCFKRVLIPFFILYGIVNDSLPGNLEIKHQSKIGSIFSTIDVLWSVRLISHLDSLHLPTGVHFPLSSGITTGGCRSITCYSASHLICCRFLLEWYQGAAGCQLGSIQSKISGQMQFTSKKQTTKLRTDFARFSFYMTSVSTVCTRLGMSALLNFWFLCRIVKTIIICHCKQMIRCERNSDIHLEIVIVFHVRLNWYL